MVPVRTASLSVGVLLLALLSTLPAAAATITWSSPLSGSWDDPANWDLGRVPAAGDDVVITTASAITVTVDNSLSTAAISVASLTLGCSTCGLEQVLQINSRSVQLTGPTTSTGSIYGRIILNWGTLINDVANNFNGPFDWNGGTVQGAGILTFGSSSIVTFGDSSYKYLNSTTLQLQGSTTYSPTTYPLYLQNTATLENGGTFIIGGSQDIFVTGTGTKTVNNSGTFQKSGTATRAIHPIFNNTVSTAMVDVQDGELEIRGGGTNNGQISIATGKTLDVPTGTWTLGSGTTVAGAGTFTITGGTVDATAAVTLPNLTMSSGTLAASTGSVTATGTVNWNGGIIRGPTAFSSTSSVTLGDSTYKYIDGTTVQFQGTTTYSPLNYALYLVNTATIDNSGMFTMGGSHGIHVSGTGTRTISNSGTFEKSGTATLPLYPIFNNTVSTALLDVQASELELRGGGTNNGQIGIATGSTLDLPASTYTLGTGTTLSGAGILTVTGGTLDAAAAVTLPNLTVTNGILTATAGSFTVTGSGIWNGGTIKGTTSFGSTSTVSIGDSTYKYIDAATVSFEGTTTYSSTTYYVVIQNGGTLSNSGTFTISGSQQIGASGTAPRTFSNSGTVEKTGTSSVAISVLFDNSGAVNVTDGTLNLSGGGTSSGTFSSSSPAQLQFGGGTHALDASSSVGGSGRVLVSAGTTSFGGTYSVSGKTSISNGTASFETAATSTDFTMTGGVFAGAGTLNVSGNAVWNGGSIRAAITFGSTSTVSIGDLSYKYIDAATASFEGTTTYSSTTYYITIQNGGTLANRGTFTISGSSPISATGTAPRTFSNSGTVEKTATSSVAISALFDNSGAVNVTDGTLNLSGGGTSSGTFSSTSPGQLQFGGGTHTLDANSAVSGSGRVLVSGGTTSFGGTYSLSGRTLISNGTASFETAATSTDFTMTGGVFAGVGNLSVSGNGIWNGGSIRAAITFGSTSTVSIGDLSYKYIDAATASFEGTTTYSSTTYYITIQNGGTLANSGTFTISGSQQVSAAGTAPRTFSNSGTVEKTTTSSVAISALFDNSGAVSVTDGTLNLSGGGTSSGTFSSTSPGQLQFGGGTHTLDASSSVTGSGRILVSGGTTSFGGTYSLSGRTLISNGTASFETAATSTDFTMTGGVFAGAGNLSVSGNGIWNGGSIRAAITFGSTSTVSIGDLSYKYIDAATARFEGTTTYSSTTYYITIQNGGTLANSGTFTISGSSPISATGTAPRTFSNSGTVEKTGTGSVAISALFDNSGAVNVTDGTLNLSGGGTSSGTFSSISPGQLQFGGGTHTLDANSAVNGSGRVLVSAGTTSFGGTYSLSGRTLISNGTASFETAATSTDFTMTGGIAAGAGTLTVSGSATWNGGYFRIATTFQSTSIVSIGDSSYKYVDAATVTLQGTTTYSSITYYITIQNGGIIANSGTFTISGIQQIAAGGTAPRTFSNSGVVEKTATSSVSISTLFDNSGAVNVLDGTLDLTGGGTSSGSFSSTSPGTLRFGAGTHTLDAASSVSGSGRVLVSGGTTSFGGTYSVSGKTSISNGTASFGTAAMTTDFTMTGGVAAGAGSLTVSGIGTWNGGYFRIATTFQPTSTVTIGDSAFKYIDGATVTFEGGTKDSSTTYYINIQNGGLLSNSGTFSIETDMQIAAGGTPIGSITNSGTFQKSGGTGTNTVAPPLSNSGTVLVSTGALSFSNGYTQTSGFTTLNGGNLSSRLRLNIDGGVLNGIGEVTAPTVSNSAGSVQPGLSAGTLSITGDYVQGSAGTLEAELGGDTAGTFDQLAVSGQATLDGTLNVTLISPYYPADGSSHRIMTFGSLAAAPNNDFVTKNGLTLADGDALETMYDTASPATYLDLVMNGNYAPVAIADSTTTLEDNAVLIAVLANDRDPDGDTISISAWTAPLNGTASCTSADCTYTPNLNYYGGDSFDYTITDGFRTGTATVSITVNAVNDPPVAAVDSHSGTEDTLLTVAAPGVLGNDTDIDGDPLAAVLDSTVSNGTLTLNADGSFSYTPAADFNGSDSFSYHAHDGVADSNVVTVTLTLAAVNDAPVAVNDSYSGTEDTVLTIAAPGVLGNDADAEGDPLTAVLDSTVSNGTLTLNADGSFSYTPAADFNGTDSFSYHANDGTADSNVATVTLTIGAVNDPPVAVDESYSGSEDTVLSVGAPGVLGNDTDIDGDPLTAVLDGTTSNGTLTLNTDGSFSYTPAADFNGTDSFSYHAHDGVADSNIVTVTLTVAAVNDAPVAVDDSYSGTEDTAITIAAPGVLGNDADAEGDPLTAVLDGTTSNGTLTLNADGSFSYTPAADFNGTDSFSYHAYDGVADSNVVTVTLTVAAVNDAPVAVDESYSGAEDAVLSIAAKGVLQNDTDIDGDPLTAVLDGTTSNGTLTLNADGSFSYTPVADFNGTDSFSYHAYDGVADSNIVTVTLTIGAVNDAPVAVDESYSGSEDTVLSVAAPGVLGNDTDIDGDPLTAVLDSTVSNGTLTLNADGSFSYTPVADFNGTDSFSYHAYDGVADSNIVTVTLTVGAVNDAPVAADDSYSGNEETAITIAVPGVLGNDADAEGDPLTAVLDSTVSNGTLTLNADGSFSYTPVADFDGTDSFSYHAYDGVANSNIVTVTLNVTAVNDAPVADAGSAVVDEDSSVTITLTATDADGDVLMFGIVSGPANGTLSAVTSTGPTSAEFTYTPNADYEGPDSLTFVANDGALDSAPATVTITVNAVADPPVADPATATLNEDGSTTITLSGTDPDGDSLTFAIASGPSNGTLSEISTVSTAAGGIAIAALTASASSTAQVTYVPNPDFEGVDSFSYTVSDGSTTSDAATVTVTVTQVNDKPDAVDDTATTPFETPVTIDVLANDSDADGDSITIVSHGPATNGSVTCTTTDCTYSPEAGFSGTDNFTYTIADPLEEMDSATVTIAVNDPTATDLTISKSGPLEASRDAEIVFTIDVMNNGPIDAVYVEVTDPTPTGLDFVSNSGACRTPFPCALGTMAAGEIRTIQAAFRVRQDAPSTVTNRASVSSTTSDANGADNTSYAGVSIAAEDPDCPDEQPQLVSPLEGTVHESPVTFEWTAVDGATEYLVIVDQGAGPVVVASTSNTSAAVSLPPDQTTWYVEAQFDECPAATSPTATFTIEGGECIDDAPRLLSPIDDTTGLSSPVTFEWTAVIGALSYRVWVESNDSFPVIVGTTTATSLSATVPSGELHWYVQALIDGCPPTISEIGTLHVEQRESCPTGVPELVSPAQDVTLDGLILFEWKPVNGAVRYAVWASIDGDTESIVGTTEGESATALEREMDAGQIEWFVEVFFEGCPSLRSDARTVTVNETVECVTDVPELVAPGDGSTSASSLVKFEWTAVPTAVGYRLWMKTDGVREFELAGATLAGTSLEVPVQENLAQWYVEALFLGCPPTRSAERTVTIQPPAVCPTGASQLLTPVGGVSLDENRAELVWTAVDGADAYEVWVVRENGVQSRIGLTRATELSIEVDLEEGAHEWWVTSLFAGCSPTSSARESFTVDLGISEECGSVSQLLLVSPSEGAANIASPVIFEWTELSGASGYQIWVLQENSGEPHALGEVRQGTQAVVQRSVGTVRWYVEAYRPNCPPVRSGIQHFKVRPAAVQCSIPDKPVVFTPQRVASGTEYRISWDQVPGATVYEVQESTSQVFRGLPVHVVRGTSIHFQHETASSQTYYYRVRALGDCNGERGSYSEIAKVTVEASSGGPSTSGLRAAAAGSGLQTIEFSKDAYSQSEIEEFRVTLRSSGSEPERVHLVPDQEWLTVEPAEVTLTSDGVDVTVRADMGVMPLGTSMATLRFEPVGGGKSASQTSSASVSVSLVSPVAQNGKNTPLPESLIIPAVAHANGLSSTWLSDIRLTNAGATTQKYQVNFTPAGVDGTQSGQTTNLDVQPGATVALNDVLANWFGAVGAGASQTGMLEIRPMKSSTSSSIGGLASVASGGFTSLASSRTFNLTPNGTFGQFIPAVRYETFVGAATGEQTVASRLSLQQISQSSMFRTNLGIVEASGNAVDALVRVFDHTGSVVGSFTTRLQPGEHRQLNGVLKEQGIEVENGRIEISAANGSGRLMAYGSVVDNLTGDPQLVPAVTLGTDSGTNWVLPGVADLETGQASWRTDVRIFNADPEPRTVTLVYYPQNSPGVKKEATLTLNAGEIEILDDLLASVFGETNSGGAVHVKSATTANIVTTGRTYNREADGGTYGQFIPAVNAAQSVGRGERSLQVMQLEQSERFRSNLGLAEVTGQPVQVEVAAVLPGSKVTPKAIVTLEGNEFTQLVGVLSSLGISEAYNARLSVRVVNGNGRVVAYGSMVDNETQDPTYVPAQ